MEAVLTQTRQNINNTISASVAAEDKFVLFSSSFDAEQLVFELGLWLSGLESFLNVRNNSLTDAGRAKGAARDWTKEFRLTHSTLLLCSKLNFQLGKTLRENEARASAAENSHTAKGESFITTEDIHQLSLGLKDSILLNESLLRAAPLRFGEWTAWSGFLSERLKSTASFEKLIKAAEKSGEESLPEVLRRTFNNRPLTEQYDLQSILQRFAKILKWLSVIGKMLERDEPLKPSLLIFARVHEQIQEMIGYVNNRLLRFSGEENELFSVLDGAAYTASIELKKVYNQELTNLVGIRSMPSVYAKIETAYSLLNDSFQQTLVGFARLLDPSVEAEKIFPNFYVKYEQSVILRQDLWSILQAVQRVEHAPEKTEIAALNEILTRFLRGSLHFLFYKDKETVERFVEEILVTTDKKDLVPILHRFGAYLETLFGQVNMRAVLANHPFQI